MIRGVGLASGGYALTGILTFAFYVVLARLATPEDFGELAAGSLLIGLGALLAGTGMPAAVIQRRDRVEEAASTAFVATVLAGVVFSLLALALAPVIGWFFQSRDIGLVAAGLSGYLALRQTMVIPAALLQRQFSFVRRVIVDPTAAAAFGGAAVVACSYGMGVWGLVVGMYASVVAQVVLTWSLVGWRPRLRLVSIKLWRELFAYGKHVTAGEIARRASGEVSTILLGRFVSTAALGYFRYAERVATKPLEAFVSTTTYVLFPAFARISHDEARFRRGFLRSLRWTCVVAFPTSLVLFPLGEPFAVVVFGDEWRQAGYALMAMSAYAAGLSFVALATQVFKAAARPNLLPRMHLLSGALTAGFMLALVPFGMLGVAAAVSLRSITIAAYAAVRMAQVVGISARRMVAVIWPPVVASVGMMAAIYPLEHLVVHADQHRPMVGLLLLLADGAAAAAIYLAILSVLAPDTARGLVNGARAARARLSRRGRPPEPPAGAEEPLVPTSAP